MHPVHTTPCHLHPAFGNRASGSIGLTRELASSGYQARRLTADERLAHARLFCAILMEDFNLLADACASLGAPLPPLDVPNSTPATMVGALRFLLRDSRESQLAAKGDFTMLEGALRGLSGELKSIQGGGLRSVQGPTHAVLQDGRTAV